jgi:hypothetical protein
MLITVLFWDTAESNAKNQDLNLRSKQTCARRTTMECDKTEARAIPLITHVPQIPNTRSRLPMSSATTEPAKKSQLRSKVKEKRQGQSNANGTDLKTAVCVKVTEGSRLSRNRND